MNEDFADIIIGEPIKIIPPTPEERGRQRTILTSPASPSASTARITAALRQLIDVLNGL